MAKSSPVITMRWETSRNYFSFLTLAMMMFQVLTVSSVAIDSFDPDTLLETMTEEELEDFFASALETAQSEILELYERHLENYMRGLDAGKEGSFLRRGRRDNLPPLPNFKKDFYHPWSDSVMFDNREALEIKSIEAKKISDIKMANVFKLNLQNFASVYLNSNGTARILKEGRLEPLIVRNIHTKSLSGCDCHDGLSRTCACCVPGYCLCRNVSGKYFGNVCVPCDQQSSEKICTALGPRELKAKVVTGFEYFLENYDPVDGLKRVIITSNGTVVSFYNSDDEGLQPLEFVDGSTKMTFVNPVTHLGLGETFVDVHGSILRKILLFTFDATGSDHKFIELSTSSDRLMKRLSKMWHVNGTDMKVWTSARTIMVGVRNGNDILIHEMEVNRFHEFEMMQLQTIRTTDHVLTWQVFTMNFENYLMVVCHSVARVYHQDGMYLEFKQELELPNGLSSFQNFVHFNSPSNRDNAILLTGERNNVVAYAWNGTIQKIQEIYSTKLDLEVEDWSLAASDLDPARTDIDLVLANGENGVVALEIRAELLELPDPLSLQAQELHKRVGDLEVEYQRQESVLRKFQLKIDNSIENRDTISGPIIIRGEVWVHGNLDTENLQGDTILLRPTDHHSHELLDYHQHSLDHITFEDKVVELERKTSSISKNLEGKEVTCTGRPFPLSKTLTDIVRKDRQEPVTGTKVFTRPLTVGNLNARNINSIPISDFVRATEENTIAGATYLNPVVADTLILRGRDATVGGVNVSSIPSIDEEVPLGHCKFLKDLTVEIVSVASGIVDKVDVNRLNTSALKTNGGRIKGSLEFTQDLNIVTLDADSIMGVATKRFMEETVFTDQPATISGTISVPMVVVKKELIVTGKINGKRFPDEYAISNRSEIHFGNKRFGHLVIDSIEMAKGSKVNGLSIHQIVTLTTSQNIEGEKHFTGGFTILGDLQVNSRIVDGVNLDRLNASINDPRFTKNQEFEVIFLKNLRVPSIKYNGTLNNLDFDALAKDIVLDDDLPMIVDSPKTFKEGLNVSRAAFESTLNDESISSLVTLDKSYVITGQKTFKNNVSFRSVNVSGFVDNVNLARLRAEALYIDKPGQVVTGRITFDDIIVAEELEVKGKVNNVDFVNVVTVDGAQTFTAPQIVRNCKFEHLTSNSVTMANPIVVNGIDLTSVNARRMSVSSLFNHSGTLTVTGPVEVRNSLYTNTINKLDLEKELGNLVTSDKTVVIDSNVVFSNLTVRGPITTRDGEGANGISLKALSENAVRLDSDGTLSGNTRWENMILHQGITGPGLFHHYDLKKLNEDAVFPDLPNQIITGKKTFVKGFRVKGNLEAKEINGLDLRRQLLTRNTKQTITAPYKFANIIAEKDVNITGKFNDFDMKKIVDSLKEREIILRGDVTFHSPVNVQRLEVNGLLNGLNLTDHLNDAVKLNDRNVVITGKKRFLQSPEVRNVNVRFLNGVDFDDFLKHVVRLDAPLSLNRTVTFNGRITAPEIKTKDLQVKGSIDSFNMNMEKGAIYLNEDRIINASLVIKGNVHAEGNLDTTYLNGFHLETDYLRRDKVQTIPHNVTFGNLTTNDVHVGGLVNSWNLKKEAENTLLTTGGQIITGLKRFTGSVKVLGSVEVTGRVGTDVKVKMARDAVQLDEPANIEGALIFQKPLTVNRLTNPTGMVNGINYTELSEMAWLVNKPAVITGRMAFNAEVSFMEGLDSMGSGGKNNMGKLQMEMMALNKQISSRMLDLNKQYSDLCNSVLSLNVKLQNAIYEGDYFEGVSKDVAGFRRHSSYAFQTKDDTFVIVSWETPICDSTLYRFNPTTSRLEEFLILDSGYAHQWLYVESNKSKFLIMAASSRDNSCARKRSAVWTWSEHHGIRVHQELVPGERISLKYFGESRVKIFVHSKDTTSTYKLNPTTQHFEPYLTSDEKVDIALSLLLKDSTSVMFRSHKGYGKLIINGKIGPKFELARDIIDAVLFDQFGRVFVALSALTDDLRNPVYVIKLYSVDLVTKSFHRLDLKEVQFPANLTSFFAGNENTGSTYIVATQANRHPIVYSLLGEKLKFFTELDITRIEWMQHIRVPPEQPNSSFPAHYVLFGQKDKTLVLTRLVMKGLSAPKHAAEEVDCNKQFLEQ
ncbi:uncharacterized protein [Macrobrachium rosenbergii]|uniref:uncharacterized protein n=1 Tax=Macrobrachium rosenbergii TaxID=79674 RepID=UPI0034D3CCAF